MTIHSENNSENERVEINASLARIHRLRSTLSATFVQKQPLIDLMFIAAVAREPLLLVGPPGTAKSALFRKFKQSLQIAHDAYFEYTITRSTQAGEILGPWDVSHLRRGRYVRRSRGKLLTANLALLNDVFQAKSSVMNALLQTLDAQAGNGEQPEDERFLVLLATAKSVPEGGEAHALTDRFALKAECLAVQDEHFDALMERGMRAEALRPTPELTDERCSLGDLEKVSRYVARRLAEKSEPSDRESFFPEETFREYQQLVKKLVRDDRIFVSDRKLVRMFRVMRVRAWLFGDGIVTRDDLRLLAYMGDTADELAILREKVPLLLGE